MVFRILSDEQRAMVASAVFDLLEGVGFQLTQAHARELLHGAGARIEGDRVYLPADLITQAVESAPSTIGIYSRDGEFLGVVVGPEAFGNKNGPADLACDSKGRIYVLDAMRKTIHVFAEKKP